MKRVSTHQRRVCCAEAPSQYENRAFMRLACKSLILLWLNLASGSFCPASYAQEPPPAQSIQPPVPLLTAQTVIPLQWRRAADADRMDDNHIYVAMQLGKDAPRLFLLDTGFNTSVLDASVAKLLKLERKSVEAKGAAIEYVTCATVLSNSFAAVDLSFVLTDLHVSPQAHDQQSGILGINVLKNYALVIDPQTYTLQLLYPGRVAGTGFVSKEAVRLPLIQEDGLYYVQALLDDQPIQFAIDTGAYRTGFFDRAMLRKLKPTATIDGPLVYVMAQSGKGLRDVSTRHLQLQTLRLGSLEIKEPVITITEREKGASLQFLGMDILSRYKMVIDFPDSAVYLTPFNNPRADAARSPEWGREGFEMARNAEGHWQVTSVEPRSPAEKAGLQQGDEILELQGHNAGLLSGDLIVDMLMVMRIYNQDLRGKARHRDAEKSFTFHLRYQ